MRTSGSFNGSPSWWLVFHHRKQTLPAGEGGSLRRVMRCSLSLGHFSGWESDSLVTNCASNLVFHLSHKCATFIARQAIPRPRSHPAPGRTTRFWRCADICQWGFGAVLIYVLRYGLRSCRGRHFMRGPRSPIIAEPLTRDPSRTETGHSMTPIDILIMAAGQGPRMKSRRPQALQRLARRPLLFHVLDQALHLQAGSAIVITGHGAAEVQAASAQAIHAGSRLDLGFVRQEQQLGTGHAVQQALPQLRDDGTVLLLSRDVPLTPPNTLHPLLP